jgi:hypothetical protein
MLYECEQPQLVITGCFLEASQWTRERLSSNRVALNARIGQHPFIFGQPAGLKGIIR